MLTTIKTIEILDDLRGDFTVLLGTYGEPGSAPKRLIQQRRAITSAIIKLEAQLDRHANIQARAASAKRQKKAATMRQYQLDAGVII